MEQLLGGFVWLAANYLYADMRREGKHGFSRFFLFWMGVPTTFLWLFLVKEGSEPDLLEAPDDAEALLEEIRMERERGLPKEDRGECGGRPRPAVRPRLPPRSSPTP